MGDRTFHIRQVWSSAITIEIEISDMGSETREKHGETWRNMEKHGETWRNDGETGRSKGEGVECEKGKNAGWRKWEQVTDVMSSLR